MKMLLIIVYVCGQRVMQDYKLVNATAKYTPDQWDAIKGYILTSYGTERHRGTLITAKVLTDQEFYVLEKFIPYPYSDVDLIDLLKCVDETLALAEMGID